MSRSGTMPPAARRGDRPPVVIAPAREADFDEVAELWNRVFPDPAPHNEPAAVIAAMAAFAPDLFFVARREGRVAGTVLAGWDGHRAWIYSMAVLPELQRRGIGSRLLEHAVAALEARGCSKVNLQVRAGNEAVVAFYRRHGFSPEARISMGRRLG